ncbi:MAG: UDP-N-acetylmuramate: L-alanyl-gamma-D-glutamyl-meso-diaminopimelate ligase [Cryomorphaceae bacterium]|jgi:UDP-N-acetylmuramate: L-alanyl-gamma-D-glutamyl-meso-diaminopimelate ligase
MKIHFIAIGGSAMHNLAIALKRKGFEISGSDDEIFEPSKSRLEKEGILPKEIGWNADYIHADLDAVVLGMHARADNPELAKANELGLRIYSYPEYIYEQTKDKIRVVIGGSHGKTTITGILLHAMKHLGKNIDYMVGAQLEGMDCMVRLTDDADVVILEGDEYLSSPIDRRPKFHLYKPHIAILTGVAWDHINVFPTFGNYVQQFSIFIDLIEKDGTLIYFQEDEELRKMAHLRADLSVIPYSKLESEIRNGQTIIHFEGKEFSSELFGAHNMANLLGAMEICRALKIEPIDFLTAIADFTGASKRLEKVAESESSVFYKDFAHAPSKLKATASALKEQFPDRELIACMELHTFSSLNKKFLPQYDGTMAKADRALIYFSPEVVEHKRLETLSAEEVNTAFGGTNVEVFTDSVALLAELKSINWKNKNLLMMSSGNFDGIDFQEVGEQLFT